MGGGHAIRWLHLSDFHVGKDAYAQRRIFGKIHDHVRERVDAGLAPDLIFITGDLVQSGQAEEYLSFYDEFLLPLQLDVLPDDWTGRILTVPGNHDVDRSRAILFNRDAASSASSRFFDPNEDGRKLREIVQPWMAAYVDAERSEGSDSPSDWLRSESGTFVERVDLSGATVGVIGVNTAWLSMDENDRHRLAVGNSLLENALAHVRDCDIRIVLGHHPLDWLRDTQLVALRSLLGSHHAIYLHGHLHVGHARFEDGGGREFLSIQSGACFQARDGEPWQNGLLWGEVDLESQQLRLQPRHWNPSHGDWPLTTDAFPEILRADSSDWWTFQLPGTRSPELLPAVRDVYRAPVGWRTVTPTFIDNERTSATDEDVLDFFDGGAPDWRIALASGIPSREIVESIVNTVTDTVGGEQATVVLVHGPSGEGKSTALLQAAAKLMAQDESLCSLWRFDEDCGISPDSLLSLPVGGTWLIIADEANLIAQDLFECAKALHRVGRSDIVLLMAARDTDWMTSAGSSPSDSTLKWSTYSAFCPIEVSGLGAPDARAIVQAWTRLGDEGLAELRGLSEDDAVESLLEAARALAQVGEGSLYAAILKTRVGKQLPYHLRRMMERLAGAPLRDGFTLLDAYAYIVSMHAEGLNFLPPSVLAHALGCNRRQLREDVLWRLGKEAAVVRSGYALLTRHQAIAQTAATVLRESFHRDTDSDFLDLAFAASNLRRVEGFMPDMTPSQWYFDLPKHFIGRGRIDLAVGVGQKLISGDSENEHLLCNLSMMYRKDALVPDEAVLLFRTSGVQFSREGMREWAIVEAEAGNPTGGAYLLFVALSDQATGARVYNRQASMTLAGLCKACQDLYEDYNDACLMGAVGAGSVLGLGLSGDPQGHIWFKAALQEAISSGVPEMDLDDAVRRLDAGVWAVSALMDPVDEIVARHPRPAELTFQGLHRLVAAGIAKESSHSGQRTNGST